MTKMLDNGLVNGTFNHALKAFLNPGVDPGEDNITF